MTDHRGVIILLGEIDRCQSFRERADLVHFYQNRIRHMLGDSFAQEFDVGDKNIVTDELNFVAETRGQLFPTGPVIFRAAIFNRDDRETRAKIGIVLNQLFSGPF